MKERAGIYARVSTKHNNNKDLTIENQIIIARRYIEDNLMEFANVYADTGYSGMDFERPAWKKLISDIVQYKIDAIVVKDFSRIGRNYILAGEYTEKVFPAYGIRLVAVSDNYDSFNNMPGGFSMGLKNIINEWYARDLGRKVSIVKQYAKSQGGYTGGAAPYGYCIKIENGIRVLKEDQTIEILKQIKELKNNGYTSYEIAGWLNSHKINRPSVYNITKEIYCTGNSYTKWDAGSVRRLWNSDTRGDYHTA